jgi:hypothetical protein
MLVQRAFALLTLISLLCASVGVSASPVLAGADVCPEPNQDIASACFLGPDGPAPGFLDTPDDVDRYRIELPPDSMIVATLGSLPADYGLRLHLADGSVTAEAIEPGVADKLVRADGLQPGTYFLSVASLRGESDSGRPYSVSVTYSTSIVLTTPSSSTGGTSRAYVPAPAKPYGLLPSDVGGGFREAERFEGEDGRLYVNRIIATDSIPAPNASLWFSPSTVGMIDTSVAILPYGEDEQIAAALNRVLDNWRSSGLKVETTIGWGSEQVYSYAVANDPNDPIRLMYRGIALRHRNAVAFMEILGLQQHASWDNLSRLMRVVESRIHAALL